MAKRLPKPVRYMLFGTLALLLGLLGFGTYLWATEEPPPVRIDPVRWNRIAAGERLEVNGYSFAMPIDAMYSRLDGSYGPDFDGAIIIRNDPNSPRQLVVGRISGLTPETRIDHDPIGEVILDLRQQTREWGEETRLMTFESRKPEFSPDRYAALHLPADLYFFDDALLRNRQAVGDVLGSIEAHQEP